MRQRRNSPAGSVGGNERIRLFCGLRFSADVLDGVVAWQREAAWPSSVRAVPRENLHITLAFLGHRPVAELDAILLCLRAAATSTRPPVLSVRGYRETRSVAMLVLEDEGGHATALASQLHECLARAGVYEPEGRPWLAHLTVARFRERPRLRPPLPGLGRFSPSDVAVYHSVLRRGGAQYEVLESAPLGG